VTVRLRVDLAYDGRPFHGFARQPGLPTVQGVVEEALADLLGQPVRTTGAGRTDRGVHADAQVLHLDVDPGVPAAARGLADPGRLARRLGRALPRAIRIHRVRRVADDFDARFSATARAYRYRLRDGVDPRGRGRGVARDPGDVWSLTAILDVSAMRTAGRHLLGEHDFASFCRRAPGRTTVRRVDELTLRRLPPDAVRGRRRVGPGRIDLRIEGPAFCHQQVRAVVGCLVAVGRGRRDPAWVGEVLAARDRAAAAALAPPHGLTLETVRFGRGAPAAPPVDVRGRPGPAASEAVGVGPAAV
jgi:tRNA pseudouridine38-40 synthase